ncbi:hypothetical protein TMatcc_001566 [Talaromyces marneffei ATCC 18224]
MTKTPIVFSSMFLRTDSGSRPKLLFSETSKIRASTSKYRANFSRATCALAPMRILGREMSFPAAFRFSCHRRCIALPPSMIASDDPTVAEPIAFSFGCAFQRLAMMETHRACMAIRAGYSSASDRFLERFSAIILDDLPSQIQIGSSIEVQLVT